MMDARSINTRAFIAEVHKRPAIWDQTCEDYNNKDQKHDDWVELTLMFIPKDENFTPVEVKSFTSILQRRWKNLRDCYTRELLRLMKVRASGNVDKKRGYIYFKQLSFLRKVVKPTKRSTDISACELEVLKNVLDSEDVPPQVEDPLEEVETEKSFKTYSEEFQDNSNTNLGVADEDYSLPPPSTTEVKNSVNGSGHITRKIYRNVVPKSKPNQDYDRFFLLSLVRDLQSIPEEQKLEVKIELMQVLKRAKQKATEAKSSYSQIHHEQNMTIKDEAESDSIEDMEEHSLDSIRDPTTPELLEDDNV